VREIIEQKSSTFDYQDERNVCAVGTPVGDALVDRLSDVMSN